MARDNRLRDCRTSRPYANLDHRSDVVIDTARPESRSRSGFRCPWQKQETGPIAGIVPDVRHDPSVAIERQRAEKPPRSRMRSRSVGWRRKRMGPGSGVWVGRACAFRRRDPSRRWRFGRGRGMGWDARRELSPGLRSCICPEPCAASARLGRSAARGRPDHPGDRLGGARFRSP